MKKHSVVWATGAAAALSICFTLCRYGFLPLHGMKEWPRNLWIAGLVVIGIAALFRAHRVLIGVVVGYLGGFALAMLLGRDGVDPGGGATSNGWILWTASMAAGIVLALVWEWIARNRA